MVAQAIGKSTSHMVPHTRTWQIKVCSHIEANTHACFFFNWLLNVLCNSQGYFKGGDGHPLLLPGIGGRKEFRKKNITLLKFIL